jgi:hypothetical protein
MPALKVLRRNREMFEVQERLAQLRDRADKLRGYL